MSDLSDFLRQTWPDIKDPEGLAKELIEGFGGVGVGVLEEARKAKLWEDQQPRSNRKRQHGRFLLNWLLRAASQLQWRRAGDDRLKAIADLSALKAKENTAKLLEKQEYEKSIRTNPEKAKEWLKKITREIGKK